MHEAFFILVAGGLAVAGPLSPPTAGLIGGWRQAGVTALYFCVFAVGRYLRPQPLIPMTPLLRGIQVGLIAATVLAIATYVLLRRRRGWLAWATLALSVLAGSNLLHESMAHRGTALHLSPKLLSMVVQTLVCAAVGLTAGLGIVVACNACRLDADAPTTSPRVWMWTLLVRATFSLLGSVAAQLYAPVDNLWALHGQRISMRLGAGLAVPILFAWLAPSSALARFASGMFACVGEAAALELTCATGVPF